MSHEKEQAVFGGGCFWCTEAVFKMLKGVIDIEPGYAGGHKEDPTYAEVSTGDTGYVEVASVIFDPKIISYKSLMTVFFGSHDSTTKNRQGNDVGTQYASVIFYTNPEQKNLADVFIKDLNKIAAGDKIITEVRPLSNYYKAEDYHKNYFEKNKNTPYCQLVINPKLEKVQKDFADLLNLNK